MLLLFLLHSTENRNTCARIRTKEKENSCIVTWYLDFRIDICELLSILSKQGPVRFTDYGRSRKKSSASLMM